MLLTIASLLYLFDRALRTDFNFHLLPYAEQELAWILHSPVHIRHRESRGCGHGVCAYLHLKRKFQRMIRSVNVEGAFPGEVLRAFSDFERALDFSGVIEDRRVTVALQNLVLHAFVAVCVSALTGGRIHENFAFSQARFGVEEELTALELEGAMDRMQTSELPTNFGLRRIEHHLHASILCRGQMANEDDQRRDEACLAYFSQCPSPFKPEAANPVRAHPAAGNLRSTARRGALRASGRRV